MCVPGEVPCEATPIRAAKRPHFTLPEMMPFVFSVAENVGPLRGEIM